MIRNVLIGFAAFGLLQAVACATPLVTVAGHVGPIAWFNDTEPLTPANAAYFELPGASVDWSFGSGSNANWSFGGSSGDANINLLVSVTGPDGGATAGQVELTGTLGDTSPTGGVRGTITSARLDLAPGESPADVPPFLADLLNHPERVGYSGQVVSPIGQWPASLQSSLGIAPPVDPNAVVPTPEPSTLLIALTGLAGVTIARRLRSGRRRCGGAAQ